MCSPGQTPDDEKVPLAPQKREPDFGSTVQAMNLVQPNSSC
jgi:hypothetical protein